MRLFFLKYRVGLALAFTAAYFYAANRYSMQFDDKYSNQYVQVMQGFVSFYLVLMVAFAILAKKLVRDCGSKPPYQVPMTKAEAVASHIHLHLFRYTALYLLVGAMAFFVVACSTFLFSSQLIEAIYIVYFSIYSLWVQYPEACFGLAGWDDGEWKVATFISATMCRC